MADLNGDAPEGDNFWKRSAYKVAADVTTVAIYRLASLVMGTLLLGLLGYFGTATLGELNDTRAQLVVARSDLQSALLRIGNLEGQLTMMNHREDRVIDRLNGDENRLIVLETKFMDMRR